jgi:pimeloyl-ACP methyl ester carboxylesterase
MDHAVALVPGFLGFDHQGSLTYFADRFIAGLRASLEARCGVRIVVVALPTPPIGSLAERQKDLLSNLTNLDGKLGGPFAWHVVGHSTGGLDAALLARTNTLTLDPTKGSVYSNKPLRVENLRTVTTISAPHYGTCLARAPISTISRPEGNTLQNRLVGLGELVAALRDLTQRDAMWSRIQFALGSALEGSAPKFLLHLLLADKLARDLDPSVTASLTGAKNRRDDVNVFSIATIAPRPGGDHEDKLFRDLWTWTQLVSAKALPEPPAMPSSPEKVIAADPSRLPRPIGPEANDGVVNTDRQVDGTFAGLVLGDHGDVIGRYRRTDPLSPPGRSTIDPGLLTSGANFGDDQFFALVALVATGIATRIP